MRERESQLRRRRNRKIDKRNKRRGKREGGSPDGSTSIVELFLLIPDRPRVKRQTCRRGHHPLCPTGTSGWSWDGFRPRARVPEQRSQSRNIPTAKGREDVDRACAAASPAASAPTPIRCSPLIITSSPLIASLRNGATAPSTGLHTDRRQRCHRHRHCHFD